ncbi:hypothetical protein Tco_1130049 [Tanacetum coccineum]
MNSLCRKHNVESANNPNLVTYPTLTTSPVKNDNLNNTNAGPTLFATLLKGDTSRKSVNFCTLVTPASNGAHVVVSKESVYVVNERLNNTVYGFFLGKSLAYPIVENYVKNTWSKFGLVKSMMTKGRPSYIRAMFGLQADVELKDTIMGVVPKFVDECPKQPVLNLLKNLKNPRQAVRGVQNSSTTSGKKNQYGLSRQEVSNLNLFDALNSVKNDDDLARGDGVAGIKRCRRDQSSDGVRDSVTASGRIRLNEDLESSM